MDDDGDPGVTRFGLLHTCWSAGRLAFSIASSHSRRSSFVWVPRVQQRAAEVLLLA